MHKKNESSTHTFVSVCRHTCPSQSTEWCSDRKPQRGHRKRPTRSNQSGIKQASVHPIRPLISLRPWGWRSQPQVKVDLISLCCRFHSSWKKAPHTHLLCCTACNGFANPCFCRLGDCDWVHENESLGDSLLLCFVFLRCSNTFPSRCLFLLLFSHNPLWNDCAGECQMIFL